MKKRGKKLSRDEKLHKRHHKVKLATLFTSKIVFALIAFTIGLYIGSFVESTFSSLLIAFGLAILTYLLSVIHIIDYLNL